MEPINILCGIVLIFFAWLIYAVFTKKENTGIYQPTKDRTTSPPKEAIKVTDNLIDNSIFDMFPSWKAEFNDDDQMREIEASCDLYVAVTDLLKDPKNLMLIIKLSDAADNYEKYVLK